MIAILGFGRFACFLALALVTACSQTGEVRRPGDPADPLPSWNDGPVKQQIVSFVDRVTDPKSPDFVPESERIATFDNDGTLWSAALTLVAATWVVGRRDRAVRPVPVRTAG